MAIDPLALSLADAARVASMGYSTLYKVLATGKGPRTFTIGARRLVLVSDLKAWLETLAKAQNSNSPSTPP
jgi:predicted DNA-binding transcriptional regulator AlpA